MKFFPLYLVNAKVSGTNVFWAEIFNRVCISDSLDDADFIAFNLPTNSHSLDQIEKLEYPKPVVVLWDTDSDLSIENQASRILLFRTSLLRSTRSAYEFCLPSHLSYSWLSCDKESDWEFMPVYSIIPTLSFCGQSSNPEVRRELINTFSRQERVVFNCIRRDSFIKGIRLQAFSESDLRREFLDSLRSSTFSLCVRGQGNWSIRFYESLKMGRIPVLLDTDIVLPFESSIDWNEHIIISDRMDDLASKIIDWNSKGREFIYNKQSTCRRIWEEYLSVNGFAKHLIEVISPYKHIGGLVNRTT